MFSYILNKRNLPNNYQSEAKKYWKSYFSIEDVLHKMRAEVDGQEKDTLVLALRQRCPAHNRFCGSKRPASGT